MKVVILCGGMGTRIKEITEDIPKPLIRVGGKPIIWHIMKIYSKYGFNDFILPIGYKGEKIKEYFAGGIWRTNDCIIDNTSVDISIKPLQSPEKWKITLIDTGEATMTGSRIKLIEPYIDENEFMLTYGDGLADINISELVEFHRNKGKIATLTGIMPKSQYGILKVKDDIAYEFAEKPQTDQIINGGYFVLNKEVFNYIDDDNGRCIFEQEPLAKLVAAGQLSVYLHKEFWMSIDTYKDYSSLNDNWEVIRKKLY